MKKLLLINFFMCAKISLMKTPLYVCRTIAGLGLKELAALTGVSISTLSRLENGPSNNTSGATCFELLKYFEEYGLTLEHLVNPAKFPDFSINSISKAAQQ